MAILRMSSTLHRTAFTIGFLEIVEAVVCYLERWARKREVVLAKRLQLGGKLGAPIMNRFRDISNAADAKY